ncbi:MAG: hypothetical protein QXE51_03320 [Nitrososphaeria archaeon]
MIEDWVKDWYTVYWKQHGYAPSYDEYVRAGGKASLQEYLTWQFEPTIQPAEIYKSPTVKAVTPKVVMEIRPEDIQSLPTATQLQPQLEQKPVFQKKEEKSMLEILWCIIWRMLP